MLDLRLDKTAQAPLYQQIVEQVKQSIATSRLHQGDRLPPVRQLAQSLHVNPNTVVRAYLVLEQERIVASRRGGGTVVLDRADGPLLKARHQRRLSSLVNSHVLEALSLGYSPEELEAAFHLHLARWQEERKSSSEASKANGKKTSSRNTIYIVGSHDLALSLLVSQLTNRNPGMRVEVTHAGSLGGLIALQEERADVAGIHLLDEETGEYNYPYIRHILPGREVAVVHLAYRIQGLMFKKDNPKGISGFVDLKRPDIVLVNRQKGSGTRVLLDFQLRHHGIMPSEVTGYSNEVDTHFAVATAIVRGQADVGLGIEAAAINSDLGFFPLLRERYDLVMPVSKYRSRLIAPLLEMIASEDFKKLVVGTGGYDTSQTGTATIFK